MEKPQDRKWYVIQTRGGICDNGFIDIAQFKYGMFQTRDGASHSLKEIEAFWLLPPDGNGLRYLPEGFVERRPGPSVFDRLNSKEITLEQAMKELA